MIRRPPRSTLDRSSAASDVYKRQDGYGIKQRAKNRLRKYGFALSIIGLMAIGTAHAQNADPGNLRPPDVPEKIKVEQGNKVFLVGRAVGTCLLYTSDAA